MSSRYHSSSAVEPPRPEAYTFHLTDYTQVSKCLTREDYPKVERLFRDVTPANYVQRFCAEVRNLLENTPAENIHMLNGESSGEDSDDDDTSGSVSLFKQLGANLWTQGYVGVLKFEVPPKDEHDTRKQLILHIRSRFDSSDHSYFLLYLFEKTLDSRGRIFADMEIQISETDIWDLLLMISFLNQLHDAMKRGLFRQYRDNTHNDDRIKGRIDIARHIRRNVPFTGNVAYSSREYAADNPMNVLILRALDRLDHRHHTLLQRLIARDPVVRQGITILKNEVPDWQKGSDHTAIQRSKRKIAHSVHRKYEPLRKTAIAVLRQVGATAFRDTQEASEENRSSSGILIDMPKLWEAFLHNAVFREYLGVNHKYLQKKYGIIYQGGRYRRDAEPDFCLKDKRIVLDAKYKVHWANTLQNQDWGALRDDCYQVISYALIFDCIYCGVIFPVEADAPHVPEQSLEGPISEFCQNRFFVRLPYYIPRSAMTEKSYRKAFDNSNQAIIQKLRELEAKARGCRRKQANDERD